ncbi:unnamed protein product [Protopolystoma xenopodis]|uniref:Uncharacterized protein n=1 Tax=Protopolystoma xenopodis TaxID=117903 RepID=A0A448WWZ4_9PLAT|nr:unnamed protein product [Protopolystoma xenopodis]
MCSRPSCQSAPGLAGLEPGPSRPIDHSVKICVASPTGRKQGPAAMQPDSTTAVLQSPSITPTPSPVLAPRAHDHATPVRGAEASGLQKRHSVEASISVLSGPREAHLTSLQSE